MLVLRRVAINLPELIDLGQKYLDYKQRVRRWL